MGMRSGEHRDVVAGSGCLHVLAVLGTSLVALELLVYSALSGRVAPGHSSAVLLLVVAQLALQGVVIAVNPAGPRSRPLRWAVLALVGQLAVALPAIAFHGACGVLIGTFAGSLPLVLPARYAWPLFGLAVAVGAGVAGDLCPPPLMAGAILLVGLMSYALTQAALLVERTRRYRRTVTDAVVESERNRIARDLHDLLGHTFSAVAMRAELVNRSFKVSPERAAAEAEEMVRTSRQAMAEFRLAVRGYQGVSLAAELPTAVALLRALNVRVVVRIDVLPQGDEVCLALAAVLRESVTNVLRHSNAKNCTITLTGGPCHARLEVRNDGATGAEHRPVGTGLGNLGERLGALGGSFRGELCPGPGFRVVANVPARTVSAAHVRVDGVPHPRPPTGQRPDAGRRVALPTVVGQ
ncbi:sensor histidine kinase [Streptomyces californicus]|uniref:sensor histidine kinase n=1 Tax=Streptomyces californicus TaxID=67351 RepID=UPI0037A46C8E